MGFSMNSCFYTFENAEIQENLDSLIRTFLEENQKIKSVQIQSEISDVSLNPVGDWNKGVCEGDS